MNLKKKKKQKKKKNKQKKKIYYLQAVTIGEDPWIPGEKEPPNTDSFNWVFFIIIFYFFENFSKLYHQIDRKFYF